MMLLSWSAAAILSQTTYGYAGVHQQYDRGDSATVS